MRTIFTNESADFWSSVRMTSCGSIPDGSSSMYCNQAEMGMAFSLDIKVPSARYSRLLWKVAILLSASASHSFLHGCPADSVHILSSVHHRSSSCQTWISPCPVVCPSATPCGFVLVAYLLQLCCCIATHIQMSNMSTRSVFASMAGLESHTMQLLLKPTTLPSDTGWLALAMAPAAPLFFTHPFGQIIFSPPL